MSRETLGLASGRLGPVKGRTLSETTDGRNGFARRLELREFLTRTFPRLALCGYKWLCPTCGNVAAWVQAKRVRRRLRSWKAKGGTVALLTLTQSHCGVNDLAVLWDRMEAGWRALVRGSGWVADKKTYGLRGYFRNTEVVLSPQTGWHVHFHVILLLDVELPQFELIGLRDSIGTRFANGVAGRGGYAAVHLQDLRQATPGTEERLADYCLKGTTMQISSHGSRTPMAILDHLESTGEGRPSWDEFATVVSARRRKQFVASARIDELSPADGPLSCYTAT